MQQTGSHFSSAGFRLDSQLATSSGYRAVEGSLGDVKALRNKTLCKVAPVTVKFCPHLRVGAAASFMADLSESRQACARLVILPGVQTRSD